MFSRGELGTPLSCTRRIDLESSLVTFSFLVTRPFFSTKPTMPFDVLTATACDLRVLLEQRQVTSVQLVQAYLQQIRTHNKDGACLRAVISVVPEKQLLDTAAQLDRERENAKTRSPYHGIPFLAKVSTYPGRQFEAIPKLM